MKKQLTFLALALSGTLAAQTYTPIAAPGYNLDAIAETSPAAGSTTGSLGAGDYVLYDVDYGTVFSTGTGPQQWPDHQRDPYLPASAL
jgi:hypothetical protein